jgi:hypothetical protein
MSARRLVSGTLVSLWVAAGMLLASSAAAWADSSLPVGAPGLPDNRAYEQVTPIVKNGLDALGTTETVHAAPSGDAVSFFSTGALQGSLGADQTRLIYIALRNGGWTTRGTAAPAESFGPAGPELLSIFPDQSKLFVEALEPQLAPDATPGQETVYEQDTATGAYKFFAPLPERGAFHIVDVTPDDSSFIFEDGEQLLPAAAAGHSNLYESREGQISLVGALPAGEGGGAPAGGSHAGENGFEEYIPTRHVLSDDGSRVFFTDPETKNLYVRENAGTSLASTVRVVEAAKFQTANADGSLVFYTKGAESHEDLYVYNVETGQTSDLAPNGNVEGVLGTGGSAHEAYLYFAAESALAGTAVEGRPNIYLARYNGAGWTTSYIATLNAEGEEANDLYNWTNEYIGGTNREKVSRVTPDGKTLLFSSVNRLTSYDNAGHNELYLYEASSARTICVSCDPSGEPATTKTQLTNNGAASGLNGGASIVSPTFPPHNLSDSGAQVFFETTQALLPQDSNGTSDVYEWEKDGSGSCVQPSGCLFLISTGKGAEGSYFGDASANGNDAFFFTHQPLLAQDEDELQDVYDARVDGGVVHVAPPACSGTGCQGVPPGAPIFATPASVTFNGVGNFTPTASVKSKAKTKPKAKKKTKKRKAKHRKAKKSTSRHTRTRKSANHLGRGRK